MADFFVFECVRGGSELRQAFARSSSDCDHILGVERLSVRDWAGDVGLAGNSLDGAGRAAAERVGTFRAVHVFARRGRWWIDRLGIVATESLGAESCDSRRVDWVGVHAAGTVYRSNKFSMEFSLAGIERSLANVDCLVFVSGAGDGVVRGTSAEHTVGFLSLLSKADSSLRSE